MLRGTGKDLAASAGSPKPFLIVAIAFVLILIGLAGLLIPIFPGLLFLVPGVLLLSLYSPTVYRAVKQRVSDHPKMQSRIDRMRNWLIRNVKPRQ